MFKCKSCLSKDKEIEYLRIQNKDLLDRIMAFTKDTLYTYKKETGDLPPLYPYSLDDKGAIVSEETTDIKSAKEDIYRAFAEEPITVEELNAK
jgi:hypothetical protein